MVVSISRARPITGSAERVKVRRVRRRLDAAFLGALADHPGHLLAQGLRGQAELAQDRGGKPLAFLGQTDQKMLRPDIGMAQLVRGDEGAVQRVFQARADADLSFRSGLAAPGLLFDLTAQVVHIDLELFEDRADHIRGRQRQQQMFGIDLAATEFPGLLRRLLQQLVALFAEPVGDADAAGPAARGAARRLIGTRIANGHVGDVAAAGKSAAAQRAVAEQAAHAAVAEEFIKERPPPEKRFERRGAAALPPKGFLIVLVAKLEVLNLTVDGGPDAHRCRTSADITFSVGHRASS
jgi:hypothetical protein